MRLHLAAAALALALAAALPAAAQPADPLWVKVDAVFGAAGKDLPGGVHRFGWPRRDLQVQVGEVAVEPALALGSWGAFVKTGKDGAAIEDVSARLARTRLPSRLPWPTALPDSAPPATVGSARTTNQDSPARRC
jgi:hypothetical protein